MRLIFAIKAFFFTEEFSFQNQLFVYIYQINSNLKYPLKNNFY